MRILVTGRGTSASFAIRGVQLGEAIGATVEPRAQNVAGYDLAVIVKRWQPDLLHRLRTAGVPIVWDIVDSYPQPHGNNWSRDECLAWMAEQIRTLRPAAIVAATRAMATDVAEFGVPVLALPHHARPGQRINPLRERVEVVGYEGGAHYLGRFRSALENDCAARGWRFCINPESLADLDIVVALRDFDGYAARHWKSNCKLANAQGSVTPCIVSREAGYLETMSGGELWADTTHELYTALEHLTEYENRWKAQTYLQDSAPVLELVAEQYKAWLQSLSKS